jgi:hypothetical protein
MTVPIAEPARCIASTLGPRRSDDARCIVLSDMQPTTSAHTVLPWKPETDVSP